MRSILAAVAVALLASGCGGEGTAVVPDVGGPDGGLPVYEAYEFLHKAGFRVEIESALYPWDHIGWQWPPAGTRAAKGSTIQIDVWYGRNLAGNNKAKMDSTYDRDVPLPNLIGRRLSSASEWVERHDLDWSTEFPPLPSTASKDLLDAYVVTGQHPGPGHRLGIVYTVNLDVAVADEIMDEWRASTVRVPAVRILDLLYGYEWLRRRGLRVKTDQRLSFGAQQDLRVIGEEPAPGTRVMRGSTVTVRLERRPYKAGYTFMRPRFRRMPNLVGRSLGSIDDWADRRNVRWELVDAPALPPTNLPDLLDAYVVVRQWPEPGAKVPQLLPDEDGFGETYSPVRLRAELKARR
jgi:beta-lactam-binding protein with PASTA domain